MKLGELINFEARAFPIYPQLLVRIGVKETVFLCRLLWWQKDEADWVQKNIAEIESQTGLSGDEQRSVRTRLKELDLIEDEYDRLGHSLRFRIKKDSLQTEIETIGHVGNSNVGGKHLGNSKVACGKIQGGTLEKSISYIGKTEERQRKKEALELKLEGEKIKDPIPENLNTEEFKERFEAFVKDRKSRGAAMTQEAKRLLLKKLETWNVDDAIDGINTAIEHGWKSVFPPKKDSGFNHGQRIATARYVENNDPPPTPMPKEGTFLAGEARSKAFAEIKQRLLASRHQPRPV